MMTMENEMSQEVHTMAKGAEQKRPRILVRVPVPKPGAAHRDKSKYKRTPKHKRKHNGII